MSKPGQQLLRVILGVILALGVIVALRLVGLEPFTQAIQRRDWGEARLLALGLVILGAALAGVVRLHPLVPGTASLVLAVLYGGALVTKNLAWHEIAGLQAFRRWVIGGFSPTMFVVIGLFAAAAVWSLFETARSAEGSLSPGRE